MDMVRIRTRGESHRDNSTCYTAAGAPLSVLESLEAVEQRNPVQL